MPSVPVPITVDGDTYTVPGADTIEPLAVSVTFDGSSAAGAFLPCLSYRTQSGQLISRTFPASSVAAGSSAEVSFIPFVPPASGAASGGGGLLDAELVFTQASGTGFTSRAITAVNQGTQKFTVAGNHLAEYPPGISIYVVDSTGNNGTYTVDTVALVAGNTVITVLEGISSAVVSGRIINGANNYVVTWAIPAGAWIVDVLLFEYVAWSGNNFSKFYMLVSDNDWPLTIPAGLSPQEATWYRQIRPAVNSADGGGTAIASTGDASQVGRVADNENAWVLQNGYGTEHGAGKAYPSGGTLTAVVVAAPIGGALTGTGDWRARIIYAMPTSSASAVLQP